VYTQVLILQSTALFERVETESPIFTTELFTVIKILPAEAKFRGLAQDSWPALITQKTKLK